tara:strand:- start:716 stop:1852 length:1137 start_codon:yes stop_codon:yes gene_type:complete
MNQEAGIQNAHTEAMNSLMGKYSSKLMQMEGAKRAREMLEDNVGTELIMAGLQSGRVGDMGKHLLHKALGGEALKSLGKVKEGVRAFSERGHAGVVEHFARGKAIAADKLRDMFPDGLGDRLKDHIRNTYSSAQDAANDLGGRLTSSLRTQFEQRRGISPLDRYGNQIQESAPEPIFGGYRSGISSDSSARLLQYTGDDSDLRVERAPIGTEDEMKKKFVFDELRPIQRGGRYSSGSNVMGSEIRGTPSSAFAPKNVSYSDAVETARSNPAALAASVVKKNTPEFMGSPEASQMIDNLRQKSATAAALTESAQRRSQVELEHNALETRLFGSPLPPKRPVVEQPEAPRPQIDWSAKQASDAELNAPGFRNEPEPFFEE